MHLWPDTLAARILALLLGMTLLLVGISAIILHDARIEIFDERNRTLLSERITTLYRLLNNADQQQREKIIQQFEDDNDEIFITERSMVTQPSAHPLAFKLARRLRHRLHLRNPADVRISDHPAAPLANRLPDNDVNRLERPDISGQESLLISLRLNTGTWLNVQSKRFGNPPPWANKTLQLLALLVFFIFISGIIIAKLMARPMAKLAAAADQLGVGQTQEPLPESGPREVRRTIRAFNQMQQRLHKHIKDRSLMLAAVSHDLRTPVTTLRLRAEYIEDTEIREKTLATLSEMESILSATLSFSRDEAADEQSRPTDLPALLQSLVDDHSDLGGDIEYTGPDKLTFNCRPVALKRALNNLIENALKYAGSASVLLQENKEAIQIQINDQGPGIPEQSLEEVFTPFFRLETSRNRNTGGSGLGLAVARSIVLAHGGELTLSNRSGGGLSAKISLPCGS